MKFFSSYYRYPKNWRKFYYLSLPRYKYKKYNKRKKYGLKKFKNHIKNLSIKIKSPVDVLLPNKYMRSLSASNNNYSLFSYPDKLKPNFNWMTLRQAILLFDLDLDLEKYINQYFTNKHTLEQPAYVSSKFFNTQKNKASSTALFKNIPTDTDNN